MALNIRKFLEGLKIVPKASSSIDAAGEMEVLSSDSNKLQYHNGTSKSPVVTEAHSATLINKTIDGDNNTIQDVGISSLKTVLADANRTIRRDSSGAVVSGNSIPNSSQIVTLDSIDTLTNKTIDGDDNTIQDVGISSLKTVLADANKVIRRSVTGAVISGNALPNSSQIVTLDSSDTLTNKTLTSPVLNTSTADTITGITSLTLTTSLNNNLILSANGTGVVNTTRPLKVSNLLIEDSAADTTSGSAVTLATPSTSVVRLTNASLSSVNMIPAGVDGQQLALLNTTGAAITFNDETGATAANRIRTGTGAPVTIQANSSIQLVYNGTTSRWMIVGGVGGGSSTVNATAGETLVIGNPVYVSVGAADGGRTAGRVYKLDATNNNRVEFIGFAADAASAGGSLRVQVAGELGGFTGLVTGQQMFASVTSPGALQSTVPVVNGQWIIPLGVAKDSTNLVINSAGSATAVLISGSGSGTYFNVASTSANITLTDTNDVVLASAASGAITITLPSPTSGKQLTIKKTDSTVNSVTVSPSGGQTIDGGASYSLNTQYQSISLVTDGSNWYLV